MKFGSLFSGIGGFDLGFEQAGLTCAWQVEIDSDCNRVLEKHWSGVTRYKDVCDIGKLESVDVICGGFPCQDLSVAGNRKGLAGERSGLWFEFLRIVELNRPRWLVIENVPGLLSSWSPVEFPPDAVEGCEWDVEENSDFEIILTGLAELGYCVASRILDAQYDGVAQRRERVFIVGSLGDGSCAEILFESESVSWNPPTRREAGPGVTPILEAGARTNGDGRRDGDGIGVEGDPMFTLQSGKQHAVSAANNFGERDISTALSSKNERIDGDSQTFVVAATLKQRGRGACDEVMDNLQLARPLAFGRTQNHYDESQQTYVTHALSSEGADASEDGTGRGTPLICATLNSGGNNGGFRSEPGEHLAIAFTERTRNEGRTFEAQEELAYAITNPGSGGRTHSRQVAGNFGVRRLTPTECERLQGFPDGWTALDANGKEISDSARYRMLGNAVAVPVAQWIGRRIIESAN